MKKSCEQCSELWKNCVAQRGRRHGWSGTEKRVPCTQKLGPVDRYGTAERARPLTRKSTEAASSLEHPASTFSKNLDQTGKRKSTDDRGTRWTHPPGSDHGLAMNSPPTAAAFRVRYFNPTGSQVRVALRMMPYPYLQVVRVKSCQHIQPHAEDASRARREPPTMPRRQGRLTGKTTRLNRHYRPALAIDKEIWMFS